MLLKTDNHTTEQDPQKYLDFSETAQQRKAEELNPTIVWQLSPREEKIIEYLNAKNPNI